MKLLWLPDVSWNCHIDQTVSKAQWTLNLSRRNLADCSMTTKELAYKALVGPTLEYASCTWDPYQVNHIRQLEAVQRKAAKFVTEQYSRQASVTELLQNLQCRSLQEWHFVSRENLFYKTVNGQTACDVQRHFLPQIPRTRMSHNTQFSLPDQRLDLHKYSLYPRTTRVWNILPQAIAHAPSAPPVSM